jgi:periplasmic protein TonB
MTGPLKGDEQLEGELVSEPIAAPAVGSLLLHIALVGGLLAYGVISGHLHHSFAWGNPGAGGGGAMQVNLVSGALPLPADQPFNQNVVATDTPSQAPAEPAPKAKQAVDDSAIPIASKQKKSSDQTQKTQSPYASHTSQRPTSTQYNYRAQYGEQAGSSIPRSMAQNGYGNGPVSVMNGNFGDRYGWYVDVIRRRVAQNWIRTEVNPHTPKGSTAQIYFRINRQGAPSNFKINRSSGSQTLDFSCLHATQRVDTFGALPSGANDQWLDVTYDCAY